MYKILSSTHFLVNGLIVIVSVFLSLHLNIVPDNETIIQSYTEIYKIILRWIKGEHYILLYRTISFIFLTINVYLFANLAVITGLSKIGDKLHGFVFLLLSGIVLPYIKDVPALMISLSLFLTMLILLFGILRKQDVLFQLFNIGLLLATASFFLYYSSYYFPYIFVAIVILRTMVWREWATASIGMIMPYFILISVYFLIYSNFNIFLDILQIINYKEALPKLDRYDMMIFIFIILILLVASGKIALRYRSMEADHQDFLRLFFILFLFTVAVFMLYPGPRFSNLMYMIIPVSVPLVYLLKETKRYYLKEMIAILLVICVFCAQFKGMLFTL